MRKTNWRIDIKMRMEGGAEKGKQRIDWQEEKRDYKEGRGEGMIATQNQAEK